MFFELWDTISLFHDERVGCTAYQNSLYITYYICLSGLGDLPLVPNIGFVKYLLTYSNSELLFWARSSQIVLFYCTLAARAQSRLYINVFKTLMRQFYSHMDEYSL